MSAADADAPRLASTEPAEEEEGTESKVPIVKRLPPSQWESAIDAAIREAQARGDFDNLPGRGRPIDLGSEPDDEAWLANHLLREQGFRPAWIEDGRAIATAVAELEAWLARQLAAAPGGVGPDRAALEAEYLRRVAEINARIDRFNLSVPTTSVQRRRVDPEGGRAAIAGRG